MEDDVVTEGLAVFTLALDDLVVSWVVKVGCTVAVANAFFVAVIGVPVVDVSSLDAVSSKIENEKNERKQEREKLKIKQSFLRNMPLETQIPTFSHTVKFSFCCS